MPRFIGARRQLTSYQGQNYDNTIISVEMIPGVDFEQKDLICGNHVCSYKMKTVLFEQCLKACSCATADELLGMTILLSVNRQYNTCQLFTVVPD